MSEPLNDRESFENGYYYFVQALKALAAPLTEQRAIYGSANAGAAWELKHDVLAGTYLFNCESCSLSPLHHDRIQDLVKQMDSVPATADLSHPSWAPLRVKASELLNLLEPVTCANASYFGTSE
jgi:hypothetical protein